MNTHRKTRGYGAPKTQFVTHRCVNFSHDWLKAAETWRQKKRREDILWHQQYFRPGGGGGYFCSGPPPHDSRLSTPVHESWLRSFKALMLCHVFPYIPNCSSLDSGFYCETVQRLHFSLHPTVHHLHRANSNLLWTNMSAALHETNPAGHKLLVTFPWDLT